MRKRLSRLTLLVITVGVATLLGITSASAASKSNSIYVTTKTGKAPAGGVFADSGGVFLQAGSRPSQSCKVTGIPDGTYYFQVTDPSGKTLLSPDTLSERKVKVNDGRIVKYLGKRHKTIDGKCPDSLGVQLAKVEPTTHLGGAYKVWMTRTKNFKAGAGFFGFRKAASKTRVFTVKQPQKFMDLYRKSAQLVEDQRSTTDDAIGFTKGAKVTSVRPLYRPDVKGPAYLEFRVAPSGYMILSTGPHDVPLPKWSSRNASPTARLQTMAAKKGKYAGRFFMIGGAYIAESRSGAKIAQEGDTPPRLIGLTSSFVTGDTVISMVTAEPQGVVTDDSNPPTEEFTVTKTGPQSLPYAEGDFGGWAQLKAGYPASYRYMNMALRNKALPKHAAEGKLKQFGPALDTGGAYRVALLYPGAKVSVSGDGSDLVTLSVKKPLDAPAYLQVSVAKPLVGLASVKRFVAEIKYSSGPTEKLKFSIAPTPPGAAGVISRMSTTTWSAWDTEYAGSSSDQRYYDQFNVTRGSNTCAVGCGPTAWAMLFGWGDYRAHNGSSYWSGRTGLYRTNGGTYPSAYTTAVAPSGNDTGIENIIEEIGDYLGTYCNGSSGSTSAEDMWMAEEYFEDRTGTWLYWHYYSTGTSGYSIADSAEWSIRNKNVPAVIAISGHAPLAWGVKDRTGRYYDSEGNGWTLYDRMFYINNGWGSSSYNEWIDESELFAIGSIRP